MKFSKNYKKDKIEKNSRKLGFWGIDLWSLQPGFLVFQSDVVFPGNKMQITAC